MALGDYSAHLIVSGVADYFEYDIPYSGKIWQALNFAKWRKKGCILILTKFKFGDLEPYL